MRSQVTREYALQRAARREEEIRDTCNAFHAKGMVALQTARALEQAIEVGGDGAQEELAFSEAIREALSATFDVRWCRLELEFPAREWCAMIKLAADAARALRGEPEALADRQSSLNRRRSAAWRAEATALAAFWRHVDEARKNCID